MVLSEKPYIRGVYFSRSVNNVKATLRTIMESLVWCYQHKCFNELQKKRPVLQRTRIRIVGAGDPKLKCLGVGTFIIDFGSCSIKLPMW